MIDFPPFARTLNPRCGRVSGNQGEQGEGLTESHVVGEDSAAEGLRVAVGLVIGQNILEAAGILLPEWREVVGVLPADQPPKTFFLVVEQLGEDNVLRGSKRGGFVLLFVFGLAD